MNKALHDIDNLFYEALEKNAELPRASIKEQLMAALDKKDADSNRRRFFWWRKMALLLFLLLVAYVLIDSVVFKAGKGSRGPADVASKSFPVRGNNNDDKKDRYVEQSAVEPDKSKPINVNTAQEGTPSSSVPSFVFFNTIAGSKGKKKGPGEIFVPFLPEIFSENSANDPVTPVTSPIVLNQYISRNIPGFLQQPVCAAPSFSFKKISGNRFHPFWQLSLFASYDRTGYRLDSDDPITVNNIKHSEVHEPSFSAGVLFTRQFSRHWGVQTGLVYSYTGIGISPQKIYAFQDPAGDVSYKYITSSGYAYIKPAAGNPAVGDSLTIESKHQLRTINIPLSLKYRMGKNKLNIAPVVGVEAGFVTSARSEVELTDASNHETATISKLNGTKRIYWSALTGVELQYKLTGKTSISIQPSYRQALSPITKNNVVETFPKSFGVRAGITIKL